MKLDETLSINIEKFILNDRTLPKVSDEYLQVIFTNSETNDADIDFEKLPFPFAISPVKNSTIKSAKVLGNTDTDTEKEIFEINLQNDEKIKFFPGDTVGILPENDEEEVNFMLNILNLSDKAETDCFVQIKPDTTKKGAKIPLYIPTTKITCRIILTHFLNFRSIPKKSFIASLLTYCENELEREFLETICSKEGSDIYNDIILNTPLNVLNLFKICKSVNPPLSLLIEHLPRLLPRPYSISNDFLVDEDNIRIIFSHLKEKSGLTTSYLKKKINNSANNINIYFRQPNKFRLTEDHYAKNIIMISIGCGISPFLGFLEHKKFLVHQGLTMGDWYLYSGFKCKSCAIYREEILKYEKDEILDKYYECFSREENSQFKYVQDAIIQTQDKFAEMLENDNTILFICADGNTISKDIKKCIQKTIFGNDDDNSNRIIQDWIKNGKYVEDIWI